MHFANTKFWGITHASIPQGILIDGFNSFMNLDSKINSLEHILFRNETNWQDRNTEFKNITTPD